MLIVGRKCTEMSWQRQLGPDGKADTPGSCTFVQERKAMKGNGSDILVLSTDLLFPI